MDGQLIRAKTKFEIVAGPDGDMVRVTIPGAPVQFFVTVELLEEQHAEVDAMLVEYRAGRGKVVPLA